MDLRRFSSQKAIAGLGVMGIALLPLVFRPAIADPVHIVAFGPSNTAGFGVSRSEAYPAQLESMLQNAGYDVQVTNAGVSGNTTADLLERVDADVPQGTQIVILQPGGNDWLQSRREQLPFDMAAYQANVTAILRKLRSRNIEVILVGQRGTYRGTAAGAMKCGGLYQGPAGEERQADGMHLTPQGYRSVAAMIYPCVRRLLANVR